LDLVFGTVAVALSWPTGL